MPEAYVKPGYWVRGYAEGDSAPPPPKKRGARIGYTPDRDVSERVGTKPASHTNGRRWP